MNWNEWVLSFFDEFYMCNGRLGCISYRSNILTFAIESKRTIFLEITCGGTGLMYYRVVGKKSYTAHDVEIIVNKLAEICADYEKHHAG